MKSNKRNRKKIITRAIIVLELIVLIPAILLIVSNQIIKSSTSKYLFDSVDSIPYNNTALVLGTTPYIRTGGSNPYFTKRMEAAARLYHNEKISYIIVSGDNSTSYYNEPEKMRQALTNLGVPSSVIILDHSGLRTLDSVVRARDVFGQNSITIVSQKFHNQRAVYIARQKGMEATAYNASDVPYSPNDRTLIREWFAKAIVFYDLFINKQPKFPSDNIAFE